MEQRQIRRLSMAGITGHDLMPPLAKAWQTPLVNHWSKRSVCTVWPGKSLLFSSSSVATISLPHHVGSRRLLLRERFFPDHKVPIRDRYWQDSPRRHANRFCQRRPSKSMAGYTGHDSRTDLLCSFSFARSKGMRGIAYLVCAPLTFFYLSFYALFFYFIRKMLLFKPTGYSFTGWQYIAYLNPS